MNDSRKAPAGRASDPLGLDTTATLLLRVRDGDGEARERLVRRYLPALQRWARGRLPRSARDLSDTDDLVQITLLRALDRVGEFEPRREGAFHAYLRRILQNAILDEIRRVGRRPTHESLPVQMAGDGPSPLEAAIGRETLAVYEAGLSQLTKEQQDAVFLRIELGFTHQEIADALGCPSANAARMLIARGLVRLAEVMDGS